MALLLNEGLTDVSFRVDEQFRGSCTRTYSMIFDDEDDEVTVRTGCTFDLYDVHPTASALYLVTISISGGERTSEAGVSARQWQVQLEYSTLEANRVPGGPLSQPLRWSLVPYLKEVPAYVDFEGNPTINAAGDPFNPPLTMERMAYTLTVNRNEGAPDFHALLALNNKVNATTWNGFPAKTVKVLPIEIPEAQTDQETNQTYWPLKYTFDIDPETWTTKVLNQGFRELKSGKLVQINGDDGEPVNDPVLLDEDGLKLDYPVDDTSIVFLDFELLESTTFDDFDMDDLFA